MQVNGQIHFIHQDKQVNDNFTKRDFILITDQNTNFPQFINLQFNNVKCRLLDAYKKGDNVKVEFNLQGRLDKNDNQKSYNTLQAWKIEKV